MTNISLAAQAVKDAVLATYSPDLPPNSIWALEQSGIVAALRAAANQADPKEHVEDIDYVHEMYTDGCHDTIATFLNIADELEGITYGTYRCNLEAQ